MSLIIGKIKRGGNMEEWRDVPGYEGLYKVSSEGRVKQIGQLYTDGRKGISTGEGRILNPQISHTGYNFCQLSCAGKRKTVYVHRMVAMAFIPNPDNLPAVNHKDEDKSNNRVDNLEWCTYKYNNNYGCKWLLKKHPERDQEVKDMKAQGYSVREIAEKYHLAQSTVRGILSKDFDESQSLINKELRRLIISNNLSQYEIARHLGVSDPLIASWLNSKMKIDDVALIIKAINEIKSPQK
jgi:transcriptional regulator with XRE-family HTH domain